MEQRFVDHAKCCSMFRSNAQYLAQWRAALAIAICAVNYIDIEINRLPKYCGLLIPV